MFRLSFYGRRKPAQRRGCRPRCLPGLETLEAREVPSTFTVLNLADSGAGSLRQAVVDANGSPGADTIQFAPGLHGTITLSSGQLSITDSLTINGPGADRLAVSGNDSSRVFAIEPGTTASVSLAGMTITRGRADRNAPHGAVGGGIYHDGGSLSLAHVVLDDNRAVGDAGSAIVLGPFPPIIAGIGGGIDNEFGSLITVTDSAFRHNQARGGIPSPTENRPIG